MERRGRSSREIRGGEEEEEIGVKKRYERWSGGRGGGSGTGEIERGR